VILIHNLFRNILRAFSNKMLFSLLLLWGVLIPSANAGFKVVSPEDLSKDDSMGLKKEFTRLNVDGKYLSDVTKELLTRNQTEKDKAVVAYICATPLAFTKEIRNEIKSLCGTVDKNLFLLYRLNQPDFLSNVKDQNQILEDLLSFLESELGEKYQAFLFSDQKDIVLKAHYVFAQMANYYLTNKSDDSNNWFTQENGKRVADSYKRSVNLGLIPEAGPLKKLYLGLSPIIPQDELIWHKDYQSLNALENCLDMKKGSVPQNTIPREFQIKFIEFQDYVLSIESLVQQKLGFALQGRVTEIVPDAITANTTECMFDIYDIQNQYAYPSTYFDSFIQDIRVSHARQKPVLNSSTLKFGDRGQVSWHFIYDAKLESDFNFESFPASISPTFMEMVLYAKDLKPFLMVTNTRKVGSESQQIIDNQTSGGIGQQSSISVYPNQGGSLLLKLRVEPQWIFYFAKVFVPCFGFIAMGLFTLYRPYKDSEANLQVATTAVLSAVAYQFVINESLPPLSYLTMVDYFLLAMFIALSFSVFFNLVPHVCVSEKELTSRRLLMITRGGALLGALIAFIIFGYGVYLTIVGVMPIMPTNYLYTY